MLTRLKLMRLSKNTSLIETAKAVCIDQTSLSRIERRIMIAVPEQQQALADFLGVKASELFEENGLAKLADKF